MADGLYPSVSPRNGSSQDITYADTNSAVRVTAALDPCQELNQQILDSSDDCIKVLDLEGRILYMSPGGQALLGIQDITPFLNTGWAEFWKGADQQAAIEAIAKARAGEVCTFQGYRPTLSGDPKWWDNKVSPIRGVEGQVERLLCISRDITLRKQSEDKRKQAEERLSAIFSRAAVGLSEISLDGHFQQVNDELCRILGRSREELLAVSVSDVTHPDDVANSLEFFRTLVQTGEPVSFDKRYLHSDGTTVWANSSLTRLDDEQGRPQAVLAVTVNLSDRKRAEEISQRAAELDAFRVSLADALRPLADPVEIQATASRVLGEYLGANRVAYFEVRGVDYVVECDYVNGAEALAGGYSIDSFGPKLLAAYRSGRAVSVSDVKADPNLSPAQRSAYAAIQIGAYIGIPLVKGGEFVAGLAVHTAGPRAWTSDEVALVEEVAERTWAAVERARAEAALRGSESRFRMIVESAKDFAIFTADLKGNITSWNSGAQKVLGYEEAEILGQYAGIIFTPEDLEHKEDVNEMRKALQFGRAENERWHVRKNGSHFWASGLMMPLRNDAGQVQGFLKILRDMTAQKQVEAVRLRLVEEQEQLLQREQAARAEAEQANRIKDEFLAVLSHELRSPLNPILGWSKLLQNGKLDAARTQQALETIERNAILQSELIEDLLDVSRILRGKLSLIVAPVNLASTIRAAMETVRLAAEAKSIKVEASLKPDVCLVSGDSTRLQQVIWNLLFNAVKFTPQGGQVNIRLKRLDSYAHLTISDTGKGIAPDFLPYVFDYFRQADATTTRHSGGLGLGLAIVRNLVELHGGTVGVESPGVGMGATFTVRLPLMPVQATADPNSPLPELSSDLNGIQVLVVDDEPDSRDFVAFVLEQAGASVITAATADEALTTLIQAKPDVLLSDIGMPEVNGYMLMRQVRALPPEQGGQVRAIALTAYAGDFDQQQALQAGFQQHVSKPVEPEGLVRAIASLLNYTLL